MIEYRSIRLVPVAACLMLAACASVSPPQARADRAAENSPVTFILIPHAETVDGTTDDPPLSTTGQLRAEDLRMQLADMPLTAIYVDEFRRTQDTAAPVQQSHRTLQLQRYFSRGPLWDTARQWRRQYTRGSVLVIGEPEAIAPLGNALCDCTITPVQAGETNRLIRIERTAQGHVHVEDHRDGATP